MKFDNKKKILAINVGLFAILYGIVSLNKEVLRPALEGYKIPDIITGCLPNLVAAYIISLAAVVGALLRNPKYARIIVYAVSIIVFLSLMVEEIKPMWGASTYYDPYDIIASATGSFLAILSYEILNKFSRRKLNKSNTK